MSGFVVRIGGKIAAYQIDEFLGKTCSIGYIAKADYEYKCVNQFAYWYGTKSSLERGILYQNIVSYEGDENLHMFQEHLDPAAMIKHYNVVCLPE